MSVFGSVTIKELAIQLIEAIKALQRPIYWDAATNRLKGSVTVENGTITLVPTVTTVGNVASFAGYGSQIPVIITSVTSWSVNCRSLIV